MPTREILLKVADLLVTPVSGNKDRFPLKEYIARPIVARLATPAQLIAEADKARRVGDEAGLAHAGRKMHMAIERNPDQLLKPMLAVAKSLTTSDQWQYQAASMLSALHNRITSCAPPYNVPREVRADIIATRHEHVARIGEFNSHFGIGR